VGRVIHGSAVRLFDSKEGPVPTEEEDRALLRLIEEEGLQGDISLLYTRRPSPWRSFLREGSRVRLVSGWNEAGLLGIGVAVTSEVWHEGRRREMSYLSSFRVSRRHPSAIRHMPDAYARLVEACGRGSLFLTSILEENQPARRLLEKRRPRLPDYRFLTGLTTVAVAPGRVRLPPGLRWRRGGPQDRQALQRLLDDFGRRTSFFPTVDLSRDDICGQAQLDFVILETSDGLVRGCAALLDQSDHKQYVVSGYGGLLRLFRPVSTLLFPLLGYPALPKAGANLGFRTAAFVAVDSDDPVLFRGLVAALAQASRGAPFFVIGCTDDHPCAAVLAGIRGIRYRSRIYRVLPPGAAEPPPATCPYVELARL
jgi:hypothetical protein